MFDAQVAPVIVILFLMFAGYFLREDSIPPWLAWIKYASFIRYAFQAADRPRRRRPDRTGPSSVAGCRPAAGGSRRVALSRRCGAAGRPAAQNARIAREEQLGRRPTCRRSA